MTLLTIFSQLICIRVPWLYNVLMKFLIQMLRNKGYGCMLADLWVGCICYADDVLLLSASIVKLQLNYA